ncbi:MAG: AI-2E family transporter, partial [Candidatus Helarchaeota archaeon]
MNKKILIEISTKTIVKIILAILALIFLYFIRDILLLIFIVIIIIAGLDPTLMFFDRYKIPRWISVTFLYLFLTTFFILIIYIIAPPVIEQLVSLINNIPNIIDSLPDAVSSSLSSYIRNQSEIFSISEQLKNISGSILNYAF